MISPVHVRDLTIAASLHPRGQPHLSSTSGLVRAGRHLYMVADDEHHIGVLDANNPAGSDVQLHRVLDGDLPGDKSDRKKQKPDMESVALLPASARWPHGALLLMGSGSKPQRERAVIALLDADRRICGEASGIDLHALYQPLRRRFEDLNIEGAFAIGETFRLLQRANAGAGSQNAFIDFPLQALIRWISAPEAHEPPEGVIQLMSLPSIEGVPLGFTDGAALPGGGWIFSAVAENTSDSYSDGACAGSALGWVDPQGALSRLEWIDRSPKVEGIALDAEGRLLMVTDADDPLHASALLSSAPG